MPIKKRIYNEPGPLVEQLRRELADEWKNPHDDESKPIIVEEGGHHRPTHIFVIWSAWSDLEQVERSEIIMDACEEVKTRDELLNVTVAMGLTPKEASRMGIKYA